MHEDFPFGHAFLLGLQRRKAISGVCDHDVRGGHQRGRKRIETSFDLLAVTNGKHYYCNCVQDTCTDIQQFCAQCTANNP